MNFVNVIALRMLLGMGVDSGVHLVHRHRTRPDEIDVLASNKACAVLFSALTTILTFCSLALASHRGLSSFGRLLTIGVSLTLVCYVVVPPAVPAWDGRRRGRGGWKAAAAAPLAVLVTGCMVGPDYR
ncbi:MAG: MMPL family transporter, partial [Gammaproteobacteria bacterium]